MPVPRSPKAMLTSHSPVFWLVEAKALSRSSPVNPISASVKVKQVRSEQVRSLKTSWAVWPIRVLAVSMPPVVSKDVHRADARIQGAAQGVLPVDVDGNLVRIS